MVFYFFIAIVFISELIIFGAIIFQLAKFDRFCKDANAFLDEAKPKIKEICELVHGISEQIYELTPIWVDKLKTARNKLIQKQFESLISGLLFWAINIKIARKFKRSKLARVIAKGLTLVQNMI